MAEDPYRVLGVSPDAPHAEIKRAFRKLARQYHPDRNPDDAAAEERFKAIQNAWEKVETTEKRQAFDEEKRMEQAFGGFTSEQNVDFGGGIDINDMLRAFMGGSPRGGDPFQGMGGATVFDSSGGVHRSAGRARPAPQQSRPPPAKGGNIESPLDIDMEMAAKGGEVQFTLSRLKRCSQCEGKSHGTTSRCASCNGLGVNRRSSKFTVKVPSNAKHGQQLRLPKMGNDHPSGPSGDLIITLRVDAEEGRRWEDDKLVQEVPIPYSTLMLGGSVRIHTPAGSIVEVKVTPASRIGDRRRLPNQGFGGGDLDIEFTLAEGDDLTDEQQAALDELRRSGL